MTHPSAAQTREASREVVNNAAAGRFEIVVDDQVAFLDYHMQGRLLHLVHTEVPASLEGRGYGSQLAKAGLEYARREQLRVAPDCVFVRGYLERHPEYEALVDTGA